MKFAFVLVLLLAACGGPAEFRLGVPSANEFDDPVPVNLSGVQIGVTGVAGLGPDDRPMVALRIDSEHRERIREDCEFVLRRERFGTGSLFVDVIPGSGAVAKSGHHFVARRADVAGAARDWWSELMERTDDVALRDRLRSLRERMDALAEASKERWDEARPELERETQHLLDELRGQSDAAAEDLRAWWDDAVERAEHATQRKKAN